MLDLEKAQRTSLTLQVEASLKSALIIGALKPGARLITKEIADQLGTSITPVRKHYCGLFPQVHFTRLLHKHSLFRMWVRYDS
jgi:DNA-binding transcriptional regulator YhcF (GntR family)